MILFFFPCGYALKKISQNKIKETEQYTYIQKPKLL